MSIVVQEFDKRKAEEELKKCSKLVRDYVALLEKNHAAQEELTRQAIKKLKELAKQQ